jgi:hypothetical protein
MLECPARAATTIISATGELIAVRVRTSTYDAFSSSVPSQAQTTLVQVQRRQLKHQRSRLLGHV